MSAWQSGSLTNTLARSFLWLIFALPLPLPLSAAAEPLWGASANLDPAAQNGANFAIARYTVAGGGGSSSGGSYRLQGTIAQPDAANGQAAAGGDYVIAGGFWPGSIGLGTDRIFANGFEP